MKMKYIVYGLLWLTYIAFSFNYFPIFNSNVTFLALPLVALGAWQLGTRKGLIVVLLTLPYHYFLYDYYGDIYIFYQTKFFGYLALLIIVLITGSLRQLRNDLKQHSIALDHIVAERTEELNNLIEQLIADDENIRRSLGQDIHDGLGQHLTGLLLLSSSVQSELETEHSLELPRIRNIVSSVQQNLHLARKVSRTLFPFKMMEAGFEPALDELTAYFSEANNVVFIIRLDGSEKNLSDHAVIHLYRILYENILNSVHNDTPTAIKIELRSDKENCFLVTEIDGCEDPEDICNNMFVELMHYRAKLISGKLTVEVFPAGKIVVTCTAPYISDQKALSHA